MEFDNLRFRQTWKQMIKVALFFIIIIIIIIIIILVLFQVCNLKGIPVTIRRIMKGFQWH
mgnify:CR=1 FL=1